MVTYYYFDRNEQRYSAWISISNKCCSFELNPEFSQKCEAEQLFSIDNN